MNFQPPTPFGSIALIRNGDTSVRGDPDSVLDGQAEKPGRALSPPGQEP